MAGARERVDQAEAAVERLGHFADDDTAWTDETTDDSDTLCGRVPTAQPNPRSPTDRRAVTPLEKEAGALVRCLKPPVRFHPFSQRTRRLPLKSAARLLLCT